MKSVLLCVLILTSFALPAEVQAARNGYSDTIQWWQDVQQQMLPYELQLQQMYAAVESSPGMLPSKVNQEFNRKLAKEYPGSGYYNSYGTFKINNYTALTFAQNWKIVALHQTFGDLQKNYTFSQNTLAMQSGANRISIRIDPRSAEKSAFSMVAIPAIAISAAKVYQQRPGARPNYDGLTDVINDAYRYAYSSQSDLRMDHFAEKLLKDMALREEVLSMAKTLYINPPKEFSTKSKSLFAAAASNPGALPSGGTLVKSIFAIIPWYAYLLFGGVLATGAISSAGRARRRVGLLEKILEHFFGKNKKEDRTSQAQYKSRDNLNSAAEQKFHAALMDALDTDVYSLNGKTRLADILKVKDGFSYGHEQGAFNRIKSKHVDFVITEKLSSRIVGVIELDDRSHLRADRRKRDQQVDQWLKDAGIPILHYPCQSSYSFVELQRALKEVLHVTSQSSSAFSW